jgi:hypothetical protein
MDLLLQILLMAVSGLVGGMLGYFIMSFKIFQIDRRVSALERKTGKGNEINVQEIIETVLESVSMLQEGKKAQDIGVHIAEKHGGIIGKGISAGLKFFKPKEGQEVVTNEKW